MKSKLSSDLIKLRSVHHETYSLAVQKTKLADQNLFNSYRALMQPFNYAIASN